MRRITFLLFAILIGSSFTNAHSQAVNCVAGKLTAPASGVQHTCNRVSLLGHIPAADMGQATGLNDIWGWKDALTNLEVVLSGWADGVSVIDVTDPTKPTYIALIPKTAGTSASTWRDIKVYKDHAYIVSEAANHGVQVVDLRALRGHSGPRQVLLPVTTYTEVSKVHNIVINEETGFAYAVGSNGSGQTCAGGLHSIDISVPGAPVFVGCVTDFRTRRGYTHDSQCVIYRGPDTAHTGKEICFSSNEDSISIANVSDKLNPVFLGLGQYANAQYVHQAWLSEDQKYLFQNDELDENRRVVPTTRTIVWDVVDLDDPVLVKEYFSTSTSIDHNHYVKGNMLYQSNYIDGLRILDISDPKNPFETAFFDTHPATITSVWDGTWSNYPYLSSGAVAVSSDPGGVYLVCSAGQSCIGQPVDTEGEDVLPMSIELNPAYPNPFNPSTNIPFTLSESTTIRVTVSDALGREVAVLIDTRMMSAGSHVTEFSGANLPSGTYLVRLEAMGIVKTRQIVLLK